MFQFRRLAALAAAVIAAVLLAPVMPVQADEAPPATGWYLALGDSLAAGEQQGTAHPDEGYVQHVLADVRESDPKAKLVNLGCRGESTGTMVNGGICTYDEGSQLAQGVEFLHAHARHTRLVTLTIGANNVQRCVRNGTIDGACIQAGMAQAIQDLPNIIGQLRAAAPGVEIVVTNYYNPFLAAWFASPALALQSSGLQAVFNQVIAGAAASGDADVADVATAFRSYDWTPLPNGVPVNVATICQTTWMCTIQDIHANDAGYALMAQAIIAVN